MTFRRLVALAVVALWSLPAAAATGVMLHVALEHGHLDATGHLASAELAEVVEHGHAHLGEAAGHAHLAVTVSDSPVRRGDAPRAVPPPCALATTPGGDLAASAGGGLRPVSPPPRARGPALLALLSVLRV